MSGFNPLLANTNSVGIFTYILTHQQRTNTKEVRPVVCPVKLLEHVQKEVVSSGIYYSSSVFICICEFLCCNEHLVKCPGREMMKIPPSPCAVGNTQDTAFSAHQIRDCEGSLPVWELP